MSVGDVRTWREWCLERDVVSTLDLDVWVGVLLRVRDEGLLRERDEDLLDVARGLWTLASVGPVDDKA